VSTSQPATDPAGCTSHTPVTAVDRNSPIAATSGVIASSQPLIQNWDYDGTKFFQRVPPAAWNPLTASAAELAYYDIPARPTVPENLTQWSDEWGPAHFRGFTRLESICSGNAGSLRYGSSSGGNWAGIVDDGSVGDYTQAYAGVTEPGTGDPCTKPVAIFDSWAGLGGFAGAGNLLQAGVTVGDPYAPSSAGGDVAFWEALNGTTQINPQFLPGDFIAPGDDIHFSTRYDLATATVLFSWHNYTNGVTVSGGTGTIGGYPASAFYDGRYADFINEQIHGAAVRQYSSVPWHDAGVTRSNGAPILAFAMPHFGLYSNDNGPTTQHLNPDSTSGGTSFVDAWQAC